MSHSVAKTERSSQSVKRDAAAMHCVRKIMCFVCKSFLQEPPNKSMKLRFSVTSSSLRFYLTDDGVLATEDSVMMQQSGTQLEPEQCPQCQQDSDAKYACCLNFFTF